MTTISGRGLYPIYVSANPVPSHNRNVTICSESQLEKEGEARSTFIPNFIRCHQPISSRGKHRVGL